MLLGKFLDYWRPEQLLDAPSGTTDVIHVHNPQFRVIGGYVPHLLCLLVGEGEGPASASAARSWPSEFQHKRRDCDISARAG